MYTQRALPVPWPCAPHLGRLRMRRIIATTSTLLALLSGWDPATSAFARQTTTPHPAAAAPDIKAAEQPVIQIAILLDTSGSMEGLINQARTRIWDVVNDLTKARKNGQVPRFEVGLYQYGSDTLPSSEGFLRCVQPFTTDLDMLSERLFALKTDGSAEFCGWVSQNALHQLSWNTTPATAPVADLPLRVIIIAGNEEFTQGPVDYKPVMTSAKSRGVFINTIYCGPYQEGEKSGWLNAAYLAGGSFNSIDHNQQIEYVAAPQDAEILRLNTALNETYIAYGASGSSNWARQQEQDATNIAASREAAVQRAASKASAYYCNSHWDLLDACKTNTVDIEKVPTADLPENMRAMTMDERKAYIRKLQDKRNEINKRIAELNRERDVFLIDHRKKCGVTLDTAITKAVREQATKVGFVFKAD